MQKNFVLQQYFESYLKNMRNLSDRAVAHYLSAISVMGDYLKGQGRLDRSFFEISEQDTLIEMKDALLNDAAFVEKDQRGNRMYSIALNHYIKFVEGENFLDIEQFDMPIDAKGQSLVNRKIHQRSTIIKDQVIISAGYTCEVDPEHQSFISQKREKPFMEGHHIIPLKHQDKFNKSLDVYANIISVCPNCHRQLHYGNDTDRRDVLGKIYQQRCNRLAASGINLEKDKFMELAMQ